MSIELTMLAWTLVLAVVQIFAAAGARTRQFGMKWNAGPRDEALPPLSPVAGRLVRAQANLYETLPLFAAAVLAAHVAGREGWATAWGVQLYFWARVAYVPFYALGLPLRSAAFMVSMAGFVLVLLSLFGVV